MDNIFNFDETSRDYEVLGPDVLHHDFRLIRKFLRDLPEALNYFIKENSTYFLEEFDKIYSDNPEKFTLLFKSVYAETFRNYSYFLFEVDQQMFEKSENKEVPYENKLQVSLKSKGLWGDSLKLKLNILQNLWDNLKNEFQRKAKAIKAFLVPKVRSVFKKFMSCLNSILGSLTQVLAALEPIKELKEMLESANDMIDEVKPEQS